MDWVRKIVKRCEKCGFRAGSVRGLGGGKKRISGLKCHHWEGLLGLSLIDLNIDGLWWFVGFGCWFVEWVRLVCVGFESQGFGGSSEE